MLIYLLYIIIIVAIIVVVMSRRPYARKGLDEVVETDLLHLLVVIVLLNRDDERIQIIYLLARRYQEVVHFLAQFGRW